MSNPAAQQSEWLQTTVGHIVAESGGTEPSPRQTVRRRELQEELVASLDELPELQVAQEEEVQSELKLNKTLGEGGMGRVYLADQRSLRREVAVKTLLPNKEANYTTLLLQESWVMGLLEHPNIAPVYQLGRDSSDQPMLIMKRIDGVPWEDIISEKADFPEAMGHSSSPLESHIRILIQVCNAIDFAHHKGILHRDIKPENIMVGYYGEVYVIDWGIAVSFNENDHGYVPLAKDANNVVGTPSYMAPEMIKADGSLLSVRTDVYLLGAVLHHALTGKPPHIGTDLHSVLFNALTSAPYEYSEEIPQELAWICHRAMHQEPSERYNDVKDFRGALLQFLEHQDSIRSSSEALEHLPVLEELVVETASLGSERHQRIYEWFGRCFYGFQSALKSWPENAEARSGLDRLLEGMLDYELRRKDIQAATRLILEFDDPPEEFASRLEELKKERALEEANMANLRQLAHDSNLQIGSSGRRWIALVLGILWGGGTLLTHVYHVNQVYEVGHHSAFLVNVVFGLFLLLVRSMGRNTVFKTEINRKLFYLLSLMLLMFVMQRVTCIVLNIKFLHSMVLELMIFISFTCVIAIVFDARLLWSALPFILALPFSLNDPNSYFLYLSIAQATGLALVAWLNPTQNVYHSLEKT